MSIVRYPWITMSQTNKTTNIAYLEKKNHIYMQNFSPHLLKMYISQQVLSHHSKSTRNKAFKVICINKYFRFKILLNPIFEHRV